jgi:hypothetical protein
MDQYKKKFANSIEKISSASASPDRKADYKGVAERK